jgi:hypothetical protein
MEKIIKIGLAILFFLCLADMPYGYYQFVRFALDWLALQFLRIKQINKADQTEMIIYGGLSFTISAVFQNCT